MTNDKEFVTPPSPQQLLSDLHVKYEEKGLGRDFDLESAATSQIVQELLRKLPPAGFELVRPLGIGSTATVWVVHHRELDQDRALKVPRPDAKLKDTVRILRGERERLASVSHQNVIRIYGSGEVECEVAGAKYALPYFIMEYFPEVDDFDDAILKARPSITDAALIAYFRDALTGISVLHSEGIVHCDIKPGNILVAPGKPAIVTDLGYAKVVRSGDPKKLTEVRFTEKYAHPDLINIVDNRSDPNANIARVPRESLREAFDLYAFGRTMQDVLQQIRDAEVRDLQNFGPKAPLLTNYQWMYMSMISKRLLDGRVERRTGPELSTDLIPGLGEREMAEVRYLSASDALEDFEKLLHLYDLESKVPELNEHISRYIQVPHCHVPLTGRVRAVVEHPAFARLSQVTQLGFISTVYPGAVHTRQEHVLGTFTHCCSYVRALWYDQDNCLFQCVMSRKDIERLLVAALVHDIAQYPMAHDLTEASSDFGHEQYTEAIMRKLYTGSEFSLAQVVESEWDLDLEGVLSILELRDDSTLKDRILHSVIDGPIDCDKLDYLRRDSTHLGVNFGRGIDRERLVRNLTVVYQSKAERKETEIREVLEFAEIGVREKALVVASSLGQARRDMFTQVYWQHTARCMKAMLAYSVRRILLDRTKEEREEFWSVFQDLVFDPMFSRGTLTDPSAAAQGKSKRRKAHGGALEEDLAADAKLTIDGAAETGGALSPTDDGLLLLLLRFGRGPERDVLRALRSRRLYRRIAVLSGPHPTERYGDGGHEHVYRNVYEQFRNNRLDGLLDRIEELREAWEAQIIEKLRRKLPSSMPSGFAELSERLSDVRPLIIVDVPVKGTKRNGAGRAGVRYLTEDSLGVHPGQYATPIPRFETSKVILDDENFDKQVGKIRVFAHPDFREFIVRHITREEILSALKS